MFSLVKLGLWVYKYWWLIAVAALLVVAAIVYAQCSSGTYSVSVEKNNKIDSTPEEIVSLKDIGQWEFLSISTEEVAELNKPGIFGVKQLVRIYPGTLRLGIDFGHADSTWLRVKGDTALVSLPAVGLLDSNFIDEARSRSFHESGTWAAGERRKLLQKAKEAMIKRAMSRKNIDIAEQNGKKQIENLFASLGFKTVTVTFNNSPRP